MGLVIVELLIGKPLFAGDDELEQLTLIAEVMGSPPPVMINASRRRFELFDENGRIKPRNGKQARPSSMSLESILRSADPHLIDFIRRCLCWNPTERLTAAQGLTHPFVNVKTITVQKTPTAVTGLLPPISLVE
jgi:dual specificity tyrosine-phosphorylation-regulated kinase 2/3/4